jgi:hypothetical protein
MRGRRLAPVALLAASVGLAACSAAPLIATPTTKAEVHVITYTVTGSARKVDLIWQGLGGGGALQTDTATNRALGASWTKSYTFTISIPLYQVSVSAIITSQAGGTVNCTIRDGATVIAQNSGSGPAGQAECDANITQG